MGYAYFDNVDYLVRALRTCEVGVLYERVEAAAAEVGTLDEKITATFGAYFDIVAERGVLLGELEQAVKARRLHPRAPRAPASS